MAEKVVPKILDGRYFEIISVDGEKIVGKCLNCVNKHISGGWSSTSNFKLHLKVRKLN